MPRPRAKEFEAGETPNSSSEARAPLDERPLPRGMKIHGLRGEQLADVKLVQRQDFEINATMLGRLLGSDPDTWMDEYWTFVREKREGKVAGILDYRDKHPGGQVKEPTGRFDNI